MKSILMLFILMLFTTTMFCLPKHSGGIVFLNIKSKYNLHDKISVTFRNNSDTTYQFYIGVDGFYNNSWHPAIKDIDPSAPDRAAIVKLILPNRTVEVFGGPLSFLSTPINPTHDSDKIKVKSFRFVLFYRLKNDTDFEKIYSTEFTIR